MSSLFKIDNRKYDLFAKTLQVFLFGFAGIIILQLINLQVIQAGKLQEKARQTRQPARVFSFRGEIVDRNDVRLAEDTSCYDIYSHPQYYDKDVSPEQMADKLSPLLRKPKSFLFEKLNNTQVSTITLAKNVDVDTVAKIKKLKIRGLDLVRKNERVYPQGNLASHILGYVNFDANVYAGVEKTGLDELAKIPKVNPVEYNGRGEVIYDFNTDPAVTTSPLTGKKVVLTIDSTIQHIAETELSKMVAKTKAERGTVIVMNPRNGEILGFAVLPTYDPNQYRKAKQSVIKNWVLSDVYPPGSTFKIITVASALQTGSISPYESISDTGKMKIGPWTITNYDYGKRGAPGPINLENLFIHSSNVGSARVALKIPVQQHYNMLKAFGIGKATGIDLPGESDGIVPETETWDKVRQATIGFGYSIASTPMQVASAVAAIANHGVWVTPHVIKYSKEESEKRIKTRQVLSPQVSSELTDILARSIQHSDANTGKIPNFTVAGKTGTSRKPNPKGGGYLTGQVFTSFVGYFPSKDPKVLIMVVVDNPKGAEVWGSTVAGPVFNSIAVEVARILNLQPDAPGLYAKKGSQIG